MGGAGYSTSFLWGCYHSWHESGGVCRCWLDGLRERWTDDELVQMVKDGNVDPEYYKVLDECKEIVCDLENTGS
jgi:hypothetical protein